MGSLVAALLTLAQLEGSPRPNARRWVALKADAQPGRIDVRSCRRAPHSFPRVDAQIAGRRTVQSAVTNLVNNAVRFTRQRVRIELTWRVQVTTRARSP
jgi:two-component system phosphate regulon sensor histidine kinase PhoR